MGILLSGATSDFSFRNSGGTAIQRLRYTDATGTLTIGSATGTSFPVELGGNTTTRAVTIDASSNVGVGVTPSAWGSNWKANHVGTVGSFASSGAGSAPPTAMVIGAYNDNTNWKYQFSSTGAARYEMTGANAGSAHAWYTAPGGTVNNNITFTQAMTLESTGSLVLGAAAVATTATDGFLYIPGCAGTPTGTPTAKTGRVPLVVDTTNNKLYFYSGGAWVAAN